MVVIHKFVFVMVVLFLSLFLMTTSVYGKPFFTLFNFVYLLCTYEFFYLILVTFSFFITTAKPPRRPPTFKPKKPKKAPRCFQDSDCPPDMCPPLFKPKCIWGYCVCTRTMSRQKKLETSCPSKRSLQYPLFFFL